MPELNSNISLATHSTIPASNNTSSTQRPLYLLFKIYTQLPTHLQLKQQQKSTMSSPKNIVEQFAVLQTLYNWAAGIDLKDTALLVSTYAPDAVSDFRPAAAKAGLEYPILEGRETILGALTGSLASFDTTHSVSNPRVTITSDARAHVEAMVEAQHVLKSDSSRFYMMKNRYDAKFVKVDGVWMISHIVVDNVWRSGDAAVLSGI